ncbi:Cytochrome b562 [Vibrio thalassae]|uniref:Cytochrome b562 n=1 Tax=Vibrio thalassae TaxID=1243014 RepID=A0A240EMY9_9VIBR|nr:cytochrome b562 [Vibrio thalassae]SNX49974.1 Cytochrome b562 [Vibrio thalassae]
MIKITTASLLSTVLLFSTSVVAEGVDLKKNMQAMKLAFKQAAEAQSVDEMRQPIKDLETLIADSKQGEYPPEKAALYMEGFNKLSGALNQVSDELEQDDLEAAKQSLREVDNLRLEYHDKRNPSIWKRLFG